MAKNCDFCKKTREKLLNKANDYIKIYGNIQKVLDMKNIFKSKNNLVYNYTDKIFNKDLKKWAQKIIGALV